MGIGSALGLGITGHVVLALFGAQFAKAWPTLLLLLPGAAAYALCHVTSVYWDSHVRKPQVNLYIAGLSLLIDSAGVLIPVPWFQLPGAGVAASIGYGVAAGLSLVLYLRHSGSSVWDSCVVRPRDVGDLV